MKNLVPESLNEVNFERGQDLKKSLELGIKNDIEKTLNGLMGSCGMNYFHIENDPDEESDILFLTGYFDGDGESLTDLEEKSEWYNFRIDFFESDWIDYVGDRFFIPIKKEYENIFKEILKL
jgi:hypothetical protein